jgi:LmbE family N-acetylglucosaminyl deacetylase
VSNPTLLAVLAHPDDESFGMGGTLAYYASKGMKVYLICATRGEVGEVKPEMLEGYGSVAELREAELRCAAGCLGLAGISFLDYRDSGMEGSPSNLHPQALAAQPLEQVAEKIVRHIRRLHPQIVLTFDPVGGYRHPDHIAIHNATVEAFKQAGNPVFASDCPEIYSPQGLYFHVFPRKLLKYGVRLMPLFGKDPHKFGKNEDIDMTVIANDEFPVNARIDVRSVIDKKMQAGACHASQGGGQSSKGLVAFLMRRYSGIEYFMRAYPLVEDGKKVSRDLFDLGN